MEPLAGVLPRVLRQLGLEEGLLGWRAVHEWERAVGPRVARHTRAVAFREGVLQIEVEGWTAAYYKLEMIPLGGGLRAPLASDAVLKPDRGRGWPYIMPGDTPSQDVGLPTALLAMHRMVDRRQIV